MPSRFEFYVGHPPTRISAADDQWAAPIPLYRTAVAADPSAETAAVTYGDYFTAARSFLADDHMAVPLRAIVRCSGGGGGSKPPEVIRIHLVKHGAFYHPAKVTLGVGQSSVPLVLNVAISAAGRERLNAEVSHLMQLHDNIPMALVPEVYGAGIGTATPHGSLPMFAGQWFEGYHELHRTALPCALKEQWRVWDSDAGPWCLADRQAADFFRQAVYILTCYFDPRSLHAIMEWHHAAGDFIIKSTLGGHIDVRLVTVRRYAPLLHLTAEAPLDLTTLLDALALFFLRTSLWMRLDRLDGVGALVWAEGNVEPSIWKGFVQGLGRMARLQRWPEAFVEGAVRYLAAHDHHAWHRLGLGILDHCPADLPEIALIGHHLDRHVARMTAIIQGGL